MWCARDAKAAKRIDHGRGGRLSLSEGREVFDGGRMLCIAKFVEIIAGCPDEVVDMC